MLTSNEAVPNKGHKDPSQGFVTGYGQSDTHALILSDCTRNPHKSAGRPYATVTGKEITAMVKAPPSVEKRLRNGSSRLITLNTMHAATMRSGKMVLSDA